MGPSDRVSEFLNQDRKWGKSADDISALILIGSYARGEVRQDSDIDLVIIAENPERYFLNQSWLKVFDNPLRTEHEDWGLVQSLRVWFGSGLEVEFGFTSKVWISEPLAEGTRQTLSDGYRILLEKPSFR
ncbi:MAG: nucleotidyltransferase domain-containing protein [Chloroflexi bacterium]|nr:nucleotidyltransferase domain-containing protein [Chloroflexota bacterium]